MTTNANNWAFGEDSITKREYFAAIAMQGIMAALPEARLSSYLNTVGNVGGSYGFGAELCLSVQAADVLIEQLNKTENK